jgi:zinc D-Ala-D-Ala dipeptidase
VHLPLVCCTGKRFRDNSLNFGTGFDCFSEWAHTNASLVEAQPRENRQLLVELLDQLSFENYANEWWHFTLRDEPFPNTYFNFTIR